MSSYASEEVKETQIYSVATGPANKPGFYYSEKEEHINKH